MSIDDDEQTPNDERTYSSPWYAPLVRALLTPESFFIFYVVYGVTTYYLGFHDARRYAGTLAIFLLGGMWLTGSAFDLPAARRYKWSFVHAVGIICGGYFNGVF